MEKKKLTVRKNHCPYCGSTDIENILTEWGEDMICKTMKCHHCKQIFENWFETKRVFSGQNVGEDLTISLEAGDIIPDLSNMED